VFPLSRGSRYFIDIMDTQTDDLSTVNGVNRSQDDVAQAILTQEKEHDLIHPRAEVPGIADTRDDTLAILELVKSQDVHHPVHWPWPKRWGIVTIYCLLQVFGITHLFNLIQPDPKQILEHSSKAVNPFSISF